jgi:hypothetical protein
MQKPVPKFLHKPVAKLVPKSYKIQSAASITINKPNSKDPPKQDHEESILLCHQHKFPLAERNNVTVNTLYNLYVCREQRIKNSNKLLFIN